MVRGSATIRGRLGAPPEPREKRILREVIDQAENIGGGMWTVSVEDVNGLSSGHPDVLHTALPGLDSLPFPSSDQNHARLTSWSVNLQTFGILNIGVGIGGISRILVSAAQMRK